MTQDWVETSNRIESNFYIAANGIVVWNLSHSRMEFISNIEPDLKEEMLTFFSLPTYVQKLNEFLSRNSLSI